mmetsp:Transcript_34548/g.87354  ORF Transcript_34548/g.87354 Transcript_34548/m.87354 type:complete len:283 (-) Transcript_34548:303-1151(-)
MPMPVVACPMACGSAARAPPSRNMPPRIMCHPVALIASVCLVTNLTMTVPTAMDCAASSIHTSPLSSHAEGCVSSAVAWCTYVSRPPTSSATWCAMLPTPPLPRWVSSPAMVIMYCSGTSSSSRPATPSSRPAMAEGPSFSPNRSAASTATVSGWLSMMTEPRPAGVRCNPSARNPWKAAPSINAKAATHAHAVHGFCASQGCGLPCIMDQATSTMPAGSRRKEPMSMGGTAPSMPFITVMEVPQKAKGDMRRAMPRMPPCKGCGCADAFTGGCAGAVSSSR